MRISRLFKKTLAIMVVLFGVLANVTAGFSAWVLYSQLTEQYRSKAVAIAKSIASSNVGLFLNHDATTLQAIIDQYPEIQGVSYVVATYPDGRIMAHTFRPQPPEEVSRMLGVRQPGASQGLVRVREFGRYLDVGAPILAGRAGYVHVGMDKQGLRNSIWELVIQQQLVTLLLFLATAGIAYLLVNSVSRPLAELTDYANRLAAQDFSAEVPVQSDDEIGLLASTMNAMSLQLRGHFGQMQQAVEHATTDLQAALSYLSALIHSLAEGLVVMDHRGRLTQANPASLAMFGRGLEEMIGLDCRQLWERSLEELLPGPVDNMEGWPLGILELTGRRADGGGFPLELALSAVTMGGETNIIGLVRDITLRKQEQRSLQQAREELELRVEERTEELLLANRLLRQEVGERRHTEEALRQSEERFRGVSDNAPDIIYALDVKGAVTYVNPAWLRLLGHAPEQVLGQPFVSFIPPGEWGACRAVFSSIMEAGATLRDECRTLRGTDGAPRLFNMSGAPNRDAQGRVIGLVGILKDITEHRQLEAQLQHAQKMEAVGTLASGVAHEFNNILMTIRGYTQLMSLSGAMSGDQAEYLRRVDESCARAAALTGKMLTFSRLDVGEKIALQPNQVLEGVRQLLAKTLPPQIALESRLTPELPLVLANPSQLEQVILNLALNARDAMPQGGTITLGSRALPRPPAGAFPAPVPEAAAGWVELWVADNGQGMPPEVLGRIFEPFYTTKEPGKGTGLGLSVAYSIIHNSGGCIAAQSQPGQGSRLALFLPALPAGAAECLPETPPPQDLPLGQGQWVLVVDDEEQVRDIVCQILQNAGYQVRAAANGQQALEQYDTALLQGRPCQLVILDLAMPVMDGEEFLARLLARHPRAKVILTTGHGGDSSGQHPLLKQTRGRLLKPFDLRALLQMVARVLAQDGPSGGLDSLGPRGHS
ncbi:MAG: PAS domain S-box protein [Pseudomonadota bacterium]